MIGLATVRADREVFAADENSDAWKNPVSSLWAGADLGASPEESAGLRLVSPDKSACRLDLKAGEHRLDGESSDRALFFLPGAGEVVTALCHLHPEYSIAYPQWLR